MLDAIDKRLLSEVADIHNEFPNGAYNIRKNGSGFETKSTENIQIIPKKDKQGIDVYIKPKTKENVHIPVIISEAMTDLVYNYFEVGEEADVVIIAGCGIHNASAESSSHDGVHEFLIKRGAKMKYVEKHYGDGDGTGKRIMNPKTVIKLEEGATAEIEMIQIKGIDETIRDTDIELKKDARLIVSERLLTHLDQTAESNITVEMVEDDASAQIISRSVAQDKSKQIFHLNMRGNCRCRGHIQCDSIIMDEAVVSSIPEITALHSDAQLVHEAAIGKIESEQLIKLMSLGLTEEEAEQTILEGFLK